MCAVYFTLWNISFCAIVATRRIFFLQDLSNKENRVAADLLIFIGSLSFFGRGRREKRRCICLHSQKERVTTPKKIFVLLFSLEIFVCLHKLHVACQRSKQVNILGRRLRQVRTMIYEIVHNDILLRLYHLYFIFIWN